MKILQCTAPKWSGADIIYLEEKEWHAAVSYFESDLDGLEVGEKLVYEVEILEMTEKEWEDLQEDFINT